MSFKCIQPYSQTLIYTLRGNSFSYTKRNGIKLNLPSSIILIVESKKCHLTRKANRFHENGMYAILIEMNQLQKSTFLALRKQ